MRAGRKQNTTQNTTATSESTAATSHDADTGQASAQDQDGAVDSQAKAPAHLPILVASAAPANAQGQDASGDGTAQGEPGGEASAAGGEATAQGEPEGEASATLPRAAANAGAQTETVRAERRMLVAVGWSCAHTPFAFSSPPSQAGFYASASHGASAPPSNTLLPVVRLLVSHPHVGFTAFSGSTFKK